MNTFADPLKAAVRQAAGKTAVIDGAAAFTYAELLVRCERLAGGLAGLGVTQGDRVAILAGNSHRYIETYVGVPAPFAITTTPSTSIPICRPGASFHSESTSASIPANW